MKETEARILVAYESRHGSTREIAEHVAESLRIYGLWRVELRLASALRDLGQYDAVVFGSPVYDGLWLPEAQGFMSAHREALNARPLWLFSVGTFGDTKRFVGELVKREPRSIAALLAALHPRGYRVFAGVIDPALWPWYGLLFLRALGARAGDNRDWLEIDRWIEQIASDLQKLFPARRASVELRA